MMFQFALWTPIAMGVVLLGFAMLTGPGKRTSIASLILIEFAVGLGCSVVSVEMFLNALETVELPVDLFVAGVRAGWAPTLWAFLVALALTAVLGFSRRSREGDRSRSYA